MKLVNLAIASVLAAGVATSALAQTSKKKAAVASDEASSSSQAAGDLWWNQENAVEDAKSRYGNMTTGISGGDASTGAASGESGATPRDMKK